MTKLHYFDVEDLAAVVCGLPNDSECADIEEAVYDKFDCSMQTFHLIVEALMPYTIPAKSALTDSVYRGFVNGDCFICKELVK